MKAITLMVLTNLGVMTVLGFLFKVLGLSYLLSEHGVSTIGFLAFACFYGFAGSFISLFLSKSMAIRQMGVHLITDPQNNTEQWLVETVARQAKTLGIAMPEVGIFDNPCPNAFATGHSKNAALVAVSTGLLQHMSADEVEAVLGHEMAHVSNGDMLASTLIQGVINAFVMIFARLIAIAVAPRDERGNQSPATVYAIYMLLQTVFGFFGMIVIMWHSRHREFKADLGGAQLAGKEKMIAALEKLLWVQNQGAKGALPSDFKAFGIVPMAGIFATHPPLEKRIEALHAL